MNLITSPPNPLSVPERGTGGEVVGLIPRGLPRNKGPGLALGFIPFDFKCMNFVFSNIKTSMRFLYIFVSYNN
jgi:hypothetical protein